MLFCHSRVKNLKSNYDKTEKISVFLKMLFCNDLKYVKSNILKNFSVYRNNKYLTLNRSSFLLYFIIYNNQVISYYLKFFYDYQYLFLKDFQNLLYFT